MTEGIIQEVMRKMRKSYENKSSWSQDWTIAIELETLEQELIKRIKNYHSAVTEYTGLILKSDLIGDSKE